MAHLTMGNSEIIKVVHLVEQLFPGADLKAVETALSGVTLQGSFTLNKSTVNTKTNATETVTLQVDITPGA